jgi:hypothetical protein
MEFSEKNLEMRGMKRIELVKYFISIGGEAINEEIFIGKGWEVELTKERLIEIGSLKIPATIVKLRCRKDLEEKMLAAFRLRFLSAGG